MDRDPRPSDRINSYSLVSYVPGRLGEFLNRLRADLVDGCVAQSHVTILPPRPLAISPGEAEEEIRERAAGFAPFEIAISGVSVFEETAVVILDIGSGKRELFEMHAALNQNGLFLDEPYPYHPHITLAQSFPPEQLAEKRAFAERVWRDAPARAFLIESLTFVQNTVENRWIDLAACELRGEAAVPVP